MYYNLFPMIIIQPLNLALFLVISYLFLWGKIDFEREEDRFAFRTCYRGVSQNRSPILHVN